MGQGQDRIASSLLDMQPTAIVELFLLYFNTVDKPQSFIAFHGGSVYNKGVVWQGIEYIPIPVETEGFEITGNGQLPRPKIRISNKDYFATDLLLNNEDLQFAKIIRKRTFVKYLDDVNFDGGNPWGQADASAEISNDTFVIGQKTAENKVYIELELTSPLDLENFEINNRLIMSRYCSWHYRGKGCNYDGIPLATELGEPLNVTNPLAWLQNKENLKWKIGVNYQVGDTAFVENTKVTISSPSNAKDKVFAKIWYVCQQQHYSSSLNMIPEKNPSLWKRDGCNKKLDGCKLRFGAGNVTLDLTTVDRTAHFIDFTSRSNLYRYNNISPGAKVTTPSTLAGTDPYNMTNLISGAGDEWREALNTKQETITLEWDDTFIINRIDIYDQVGQTNLENAYIRYFNTTVSDEPFASGRYAILDNGTRSTTGFADREVNKIIISGSGVYVATALSEIAVFESKPPFLYLNDKATLYDNGSKPYNIHNYDVFHIASWIELQDRNYYYDEIYSIFQNVKGNCRHSGINVYLSGNKMVLDFATRSGTVVNKRSLTLPWENDQLKALHLVCSGGYASGLAPTTATAGYIQLTDGVYNFSTYTLPQNEHFVFKNPTYQSGMKESANRLRFGINDWQCPTGSEFTPDPPLPQNRISSNMALISPIKFGTTAFWTGGDALLAKMDEFNQSVFKYYSDFNAENPINKNLYAWFEMDGDNPSYSVPHIDSANVQSISPPVYMEAQVPSNYNKNIINTSSQGKISLGQLVSIQKESIDLPFGGFPGTEKYG